MEIKGLNEIGKFYQNVDLRDIDCEIHGIVPALLNGKCGECYQEQKRKAKEEEYEGRVLAKKQYLGLPTKFIHVKFSNLTAINQKQQTMFDYFSQYKYDKHLILLGTVGSGKTCMSMALADKAVRDGYSVAYTKFYNINNLSPWSEEFNRLLKVDLLIIDEIGVSESEKKDETLFKLIDQRYDNNRFGVFISNAHLLEFKKGLSASAYSKIQENAKVMITDWHDLRIKKEK